jgi:hypothetical protein
MALYKGEADIVLTVTVEAEGESDPKAIEAATDDLRAKITSGEISLNDAAYVQRITINNLRRIG